VAPRGSPRRQSRPSGGLIAVAPGALLMLAISVAPMLWLLGSSVFTNRRFGSELPFTLDSYREILDSPLTWRFLLNSLRIGLPTAVVTVAAAVPVAYWLHFAARKSRTVVIFLIVATLVVSYLVRIYAWRTMLGQNGVINFGLERAGLVDEPLQFLLFSRFATVIGLTHLLLPVVVVLLIGAFRPIQAGYLEAATDLGAGRLVVWLRILMPMLAQPMVTAFLFVVVVASSDWATSTFLGGGRNTMLGEEIQRSFQVVGNYPRGAAYAVVLVAALAIALVVVHALLHAAGLGNLRSGDAAPGAPRSATLAGAWTAAVVVFLWVPLVVVVLFSFHATAGLSLPYEGFSLRWYSELFHDELGAEALTRSLWLAVVVTTITALVGIPAAFGLSRLRPLLRRSLMIVFLAPIALPPLMIGAGLLSYVAALGLDLSSRTTAVGHLVLTIPLFVLVVATSVDRLDPALAELAADLGASPMKVLTRSTLPQVWPAVLGGSVLTFAVSFDEFPVSVFVSGSATTLPLYIYAQLRRTVDPRVNAASTLLLGALVAVGVTAAVVIRASRRRGVRLETATDEAA
jgi:spermidine/putrescine transport system permease protein